VRQGEEPSGATPLSGQSAGFSHAFGGEVKAKWRPIKAARTVAARTVAAWTVAAWTVAAWTVVVPVA